jgi:hypothetical protein
LKNEAEQRAKNSKEELFTKFGSILGDAVDTFKATADQFTLEQLEEKLSVIAFKKGVNFVADNEPNGVMTPKVSNTIDSDMPAWVKAVEKKSQSKNY